MQSGTITLYGLNERKKVISQILKELNLEEESFDLELILTEAIINAYKHGNKKDDTKPIHLKYFCDPAQVVFEVTDCGSGFKGVEVPTEISDDNLLAESGRGLYLISCFADDLNFRDNTLIVTKRLKKAVVLS